MLGVAPVVSAQSVTAHLRRRLPHGGDVHRHHAGYLLIDNDTVTIGAGVHRRRLRRAPPGRARRHDGRRGPRRRRRHVDRRQDRDVQRQGVHRRRHPGPKGSTGPQDQDDRVIAPATAVQDTLAGYGRCRSISVKASSAATTTSAPGRGPVHPRRSPPCHLGRPRLQRLQLLVDPLGRHLVEQDVHRPPRRRRRDLAARRRHRGHEHHAGHRHRADPRDRHPQGHRRPQAATSSASSCWRR